MGTVLLYGLAEASGPPLLHPGRQESYATFEKVVLTLCLGFSLALPALLPPMIAFA